MCRNLNCTPPTPDTANYKIVKRQRSVSVLKKTSGVIFFFFFLKINLIKGDIDQGCCLVFQFNFLFLLFVFNICFFSNSIILVVSNWWRFFFFPLYFIPQDLPNKQRFNICFWASIVVGVDVFF